MAILNGAASLLSQVWSHAPKWLRLLIAAAAFVLGVAILFQPTASLGLLALLIGVGLVLQGLVEFGESAGRHAGETRSTGLGYVVAATWIAAGLIVLAFPGLTVRLVAVTVGIALIVSGTLSVIRAFRSHGALDSPIADGAFGVAGVAFGLLALAWPDITLLVLSIVFAARLMLGALSLGWRTVHTRSAATRQPASSRRWPRTALALLTAIAALALGLVSGQLRGATASIDSFYTAPRDVPATPGRLIRAEPFVRDVPADARAWRILYTTTRGDGAAATASGIVVVPTNGPGSWPVISWDHGTTGFARTCAPSLLSQPFASGALFVLPEVIAQGWALVATDYIGLGTPGPHPYLIGNDSAYATLDAVRAARELPQADLGRQTAVWGHSQGGGAALWTGALAGAYAPDIELAGVAALAPAANLPALVEHLPSVTGGSIFGSFAFAAYAAIYPDVTYRQYIRPGAEPILRAMASRCLANPDTLASVLDVLALGQNPRIFAKDPTTGAMGERLEQNIPPATITAPLLIAQGASDTLVVPAAQDAYVGQACAEGESVDYRTYAGLDHVPLVAANSPLIPELLAWTADRFGGVPAESGCTTRTG